MLDQPHLGNIQNLRYRIWDCKHALWYLQHHARLTH
jgi:hypothetical protein